LGDAKGGERLVAFTGTFVLGGALLTWWAILFRPGLAAIGARIATRCRDRVIGLVPTRHRDAVQHVDLHAEADRLRTLGRQLVRDRFASMMFAVLASQVTIGFVLVSCLIAVEPERNLPILSILGVFALARVLGSLAPLPGGIGVLDVGLASGLVHLGVARPSAIAAIALFRALTFVLPIATGMLSLAIARRVDAARRPARLAPVAAAVTAAIEPVVAPASSA
jgi:uncharacterized membrane protein YbhN (UPF0104 family)